MRSVAEVPWAITTVGRRVPLPDGVTKYPLRVAPCESNATGFSVNTGATRSPTR